MMERLSSAIQKKYSYLNISTAIIAIIAGLLAPSAVQILKPYMLPAVILMIWAMCTTMRFKEIALATKKVKQIIFGLLLNFGFMPLLCFFSALIFLSSNPTWAVGFILMGTVPTAGMSIVWTGLLKGDTPLALVIGALTMLLGIAVIPTLTALLAGVYVEINVLDLARTVILILAIPLTLGVVTRESMEKLTIPTKNLAILPSISALISLFLIFTMISVNISLLPPEANVILSLILPPLLVFSMGFAGIYMICSKLLNLPRKETIAIVYSSGMKHLPMAIGLAFASFGQMAALPIALSVPFQTTFASVYYRIFQKII